MTFSITPVGWVSSGTAVSITTSSISVVAGDMLIACGQGETAFVSITDSGSGSWTSIQMDTANAGGMHYRTFSGSTSLTVTWTQTLSGYGIALQVYKVQGFQVSAPFGGVGRGNSSTQNVTPTIFTSTVANSTALVNAGDYNGRGTPTSSDLTIDTYDRGPFPGGSGLTGIKTLGATGSQTANMNAGAVSPAWYWTAVEVIPSPPIADSTVTTSTAVTATAYVSQQSANSAVATSTTVVTSAYATTPANATSTITTTVTATILVADAVTTTTTTVTTGVTVTPPEIGNASPTLVTTVTTGLTVTSPANAVSVNSVQVHAGTLRSGAVPTILGVYGSLSIGRLTLTESPESESKSSSSNGRVLSLAGQEASPALSADQDATRERIEGLLAYDGAVVPVRFDAKPHLNGWYQVDSPEASEETWNDITTIRWACDLLRVGANSEIEVESRLIGGNRTHSTPAVAELWHAAAVGADGYLVGASSPGYVSRAGVDGTLIVYRGIPAGTNPRWGSSVENHLLGAASIVVNGVPRTGTTCADTPMSWTLSNGLLKVEPRTTTGTLRITSYLSSSWGTAKVFDLKRGTVSLGTATHVTVLRNDPCEVVMRLTFDHAPGRTTVDLSLKRGARHVAIHVQQYAAPSTLRVDDNGGGGTVNDQLTAAGYIASTTNDTDGSRWVIGTPLASGAAGTFGLAATVAATSLPAYIGCVVGGASPAAGDAAADINAQYIGTPTETERLILR